MLCVSWSICKAGPREPGAQAEAGLSVERLGHKRHTGKAEKKCYEQPNGCAQGYKSIEVEVKLKSGKHVADAGDECLIITWRGTCDCVSAGDGGAPQCSGALGLMSSQLRWISRGLSTASAAGY